MADAADTATAAADSRQQEAMLADIRVLLDKIPKPTVSAKKLRRMVQARRGWVVVEEFDDGEVLVDTAAGLACGFTPRGPGQLALTSVGMKGSPTGVVMANPGGTSWAFHFGVVPEAAHCHGVVSRYEDARGPAVGVRHTVPYCGCHVPTCTRTHHNPDAVYPFIQTLRPGVRRSDVFLCMWPVCTCVLHHLPVTNAHRNFMHAALQAMRAPAEV